MRIYSLPCVALLASMAVPSVGLAADLPVKAPMMAVAADPWVGPYVGVNVGYGSGKTKAQSAGTLTAIAGGGPAFNASIDNSLTGVVGGGQLGYNWRFGSGWIFGLETDFQGSDQKGNITIGGGFATVTAQQKLDWFGTVRARFGTVIGNTLWYGTGGFAYGHREATETVSNVIGGALAATGTFNSSKTVGGWTVGAGAETKLTGNWSVKLEYLYMQLDGFNGAFAENTTAAFPPAGAAFANVTASSGTLRNNVARIGVNYKF